MHDSREKPYKCDLCDIRTTTSGDLKTHKRIHSGKIPHKCDLYDYSCKTSGVLKTYTDTHREETLQV